MRFELNLPADWNRRFYMHGNGGFAGETPESGPRPMVRANALKQGFATVQTNTGHDANAEPLASFAADYAKRVDYAFRAVHMTVTEAQEDRRRLLRPRAGLLLLGRLLDRRAAGPDQRPALPAGFRRHRWPARRC